MLGLTIYLLVVNLKSKNNIRKVLRKGVVIGIESSHERVKYDGISVWRPNMINYIKSDGTKGSAHYSDVIVYT